MTPAGCGAREHLTRTHGVASHDIFRLQKLRPDAGRNSAPELGLDSQEAAIVAETYRKGLVPKGERSVADQQPILFVAPEPKK